MLLVAACSKSKFENPNAVNPPEITTDGGEGGECDPLNSSNPWDDVGIYHNEALEYVKEQAGSVANLAEYVGYSNTYVVNTFGEQMSMEELETLLPSPDQVESILADEPNWYSNVIESSSYSAAVKEKFSNLIALIIDTDGYEDADYCTVKGQIVDFEEQILADETLSTEEKDQVLRVSSVARHSLYFWYMQYLETEGTAKRKWWQWLVVGVADVAGGIAGGIATGPTVVGVVAGAVAGAAGASSGAAAVMEYFEK
jgi:hypothetical protein